MPAAVQGPIRLAVSRTRPPAFVSTLAQRIGAELVPMGSAGVKATAVLDGTVDAYVHAGGQYEWDSAAPVAVARSAGLHASRIDGSPLRYNQPDPLLPDLLICRPEHADAAADGHLRPERRGRIAVMSPTPDYQLSQLDLLEAEAIYIMREVVAEFERPVLLFSGGKDSIVMLKLAEKAFHPARIPFAVMHVDTGHNFDEVLALRDKRVDELKVQLIVASVQEAIDAGTVCEPPDGTRNRIQTPVLLDALDKHRFTAIFGGARRDEDKARAKERIFSFRDEFGQWDPKNQRPELWNLYNGRHPHGGEHPRLPAVELDRARHLALHQARGHRAARRSTTRTSARCSTGTGCSSRFTRPSSPSPARRCSPRWCATAPSATRASRPPCDPRPTPSTSSSPRWHPRGVTERGATRGDDKFSEAAMEDRKREGYF